MKWDIGLDELPDMDFVTLGFGEDIGSFQSTTSLVHSGTHSGLLQSQGSGLRNSWGIVGKVKFPEPQDVSQFNSISYWIRSQTDNSDITVAIALSFGEGNTGKLIQHGTWQQNVNLLTLADILNDWKKVSLGLASSNFIRTAGSGDFDLRKVIGIELLMLRNQGQTDTITEVYLDDFHFTTDTGALDWDIGLDKLPGLDFVTQALGDDIGGFQSVTSLVHSGTHSGLLRSKESGLRNSWGIVGKIEFTEPQDVSQFNSISYWIRSQTDNSDITVAIAFSLGEGNADNFTHHSTWQQSVNLLTLADILNDWKKVSLGLASHNFIRTAGSGDFDLGKVIGIELLMLRNQGQTDTTTAVYFDDFHFSLDIYTHDLAQTITIELPYDKAENLRCAIKRGEFNKYGAVDAEILD